MMMMMMVMIMITMLTTTREGRMGIDRVSDAVEANLHSEVLLFTPGYKKILITDFVFFIHT